jgi:hypothetical protein
VPTSGNPSVKRRAAAKVALLPDFTGNVVAADQAAMHRSRPYYCIARGGELWFERLDFDAFQRFGQGACKGHLKAVCHGADRAAFLAVWRNASGI